MMTVRFPNGQAIQYNTAGFVLRNTSYTDIYVKEGGQWIAQVPNTCVIESVRACKVYNGLQNAESQKFIGIEKELRSLKRKIEPKKR